MATTLTVLPGCCVSRHTALDGTETAESFWAANSMNTYLYAGSACVLVVQENQKDIFEVLDNGKVPYELVLGNGSRLYHGDGRVFIDAFTAAKLKNPLHEFEKEDGRKRGELRVGDIFSPIGVTHIKNKVVRMSSTYNGYVIFEQIVPPSTRLFDNYGQGYAPGNYVLDVEATKEARKKAAEAEAIAKSRMAMDTVSTPTAGVVKKRVLTKKKVA